MVFDRYNHIEIVAYGEQRLGQSRKQIYHSASLTVAGEKKIMLKECMCEY
jgi:hypothetical protein